MSPTLTSIPVRNTSPVAQRSRLRLARESRARGFIGAGDTCRGTAEPPRTCVRARLCALRVVPYPLAYCYGGGVARIILRRLSLRADRACLVSGVGSR